LLDYDQNRFVATGSTSTPEGFRYTIEAVSAATATFTLADLERMPDDGMHREILHGELIELPPPKLDHSDCASALFAALILYLRQRPRLGRAYAEAGYRVLADDRSWLQPDVSFLAQHRWEQTADGEFVTGAPDVAFEVVSPSESAADIEAKSIAYLKANARAVVWIYPKTRTVHIIGEGERRLAESDVLELPTVLPGWTLPVRDLFPR
jgi:Uma2 family endonuclease